MAYSFDAATFDPLAQDSIYPVWSKAGIVVPKKVPGGDLNVIQKIGVDLPRLALPIKGTVAQMIALQAKVGVSGTLIFTYETCVARLESMEPPVSHGIDNDLYTSVMHLIRTASITFAATNTILMQTGAVILTEAGDDLILEV